MRLRIVLAVLSLLSFLSVSVAGYIYYTSLKRSMYREAESEIALQAERIQKSLSAYLSGNLKTVKALGGIPEMRVALQQRRGAALERANALLDHFREALGADVCYLMDDRGITIASSNRKATDSFVGKDFAFRPYWRNAIRGEPSSYMALGVASHVRGIYYSHPVYAAEGIDPVGVVVIKAPVERIEAEFGRGFEGTVLLADPNGIVFSSNRRDWIHRSLRQLSPEAAAQIARTKQFGPGPWESIGLEGRGGDAAVDATGTEFLSYRMTVDNFPGWELICLRNAADISRKVSGPLVNVTGPILLALCLLVSLSVVFVYRMGSEDLARRKQAEEALRDAKEELRRYSLDLERQVRERTREITSILKYTPAVVYIRDAQGKYTFVNSRYEELFGKGNEELRGKTVHDVFPREFADRFRASDRRVLEEGRPCQVEENVPLADGVHVYLSTKYPIRAEQGATIAVCGISIDITEIKKARDQTRRLSDSIIASQERERAAVSRELHDELGQVLTALHLDTVWLRERLKGRDGEASERARAMCGLIDRAIGEVRAMATRLRPGVLDNLGLVDALDWFIGDFRKRSNVTCRFRHSDMPKVDDRIATAAYRIAQEALTNVARHSAASRVDVSLRARDGCLLLSVEDDGRGLDLRELLESGGLGVAGMRERAELIGGALAIRSRPGGGTTVELTIPLAAPTEAVH